MSQLVGQGEDLGGLGISPVDEYERCKRVGQGEATKLIGIKRPLIVAADDAADHHQYAGVLSPLDEQSQGIGPGWAAKPLLDLKRDMSANLGCDLFGAIRDLCRTDECAAVFVHALRVILVPRLAPLA